MRSRSSSTRTAGVCAVAAAAVAVLVVGCGSPEEDGRAARVTQADSASHSDPRAQTGVAVGLDEDAPSYVQYGDPDRVQARCHGSGDALRIALTTADGWEVSLSHGAQQVTARNSALGFDTAEFTTADATRAASALRHPHGTSLGLTWDHPAVGDVEVKLKDQAPPAWTTPRRGSDFMTFLHVSCHK